MVKIASIFILGLGIGYAVHTFQTSKKIDSLEQSLKESQKQTEDLKTQIQTFKTHISELSSDGSNKSAEEILGKIMQIFLADLSLRLKAPEAATTPVSSEPSHPQQIHATAPVETKKEEPSAPPVPAKKLGTPMAHEIEKRIANARSEQEAVDTLGQARLENFFEVLSQAKPIDQKSSLVLEGHFTGQTQPFDNQRKIVTVKMSVQLNPGTGNSAPTGKVHIVESKDGKVFSRSRGEGNLKNFSLYEGSTMIVVEHNGGDNYFQLYYSTQGDFFAGNDYEKVSASKYVPVGTIVLQRSR